MIREPEATRRVLVVDDDPLLGRSVRRLLERAGFEVSISTTAEDAIQTLTSWPPDVLLSDVRLPGASGVELARRVRAHDPDLPVILMTGAPTVETAMEAVSLGALQYLPKPTPNEALVGAVERAWRLRRMARAKRGGAPAQ